jgi:hypothetical protein
VRVLAQLIATVTLLAQSGDTEYAVDPAVGMVSALIGAGVGAWIGSTRGRTVLGAVLGFFCGCIGWLIMLLAFKPRPRY